MNKKISIMVTFATALCLAATVATALASQGDPLSAASAESKPVIQALVTGGFIALPDHGVRINSDGSVVAFKGLRTASIGTLGPAAMTALRNEIEAATGPLKDQNPDAPRCVDRPTTYYVAYKASGERFVAAKDADCRIYLADGAYGLKLLLEGFLYMNVLPTVYHCPVIDCAAPLPHCHYGQAPVDDNGCRIGCGQLICRNSPPQTM